MSIVRVSNGIAGEANGASETGFIRSITLDNGKLVFESSASNLVAGDTNGASDVYLFDIATGAISRVSTDSLGGEGSGASIDASVSTDGRYIAFKTLAGELSGNGGTPIVVRKDLLTGEVVSTGIAPQPLNTDEGPELSADGRYLVTSTAGIDQIFRYDFDTSSSVTVTAFDDGTPGSGLQSSAAISGDGTKVVFFSNVQYEPGDGTSPSNGYDIFLKNLSTGDISRLSNSLTGTDGNGDSFGPRLSSDGRYAVFHSYASNLFADDTNGTRNVFRLDLATGELRVVDTAADGTPAGGGSGSHSASISADGRFIAFTSAADNLVAGDTNSVEDVFVKDMDTGKIIRVSVAENGAEGNGSSYRATISEDGRYVAFSSGASNLVAGDTNGVTDVFLVDLADTDFINAAPTAVTLLNAVTSLSEAANTASRIKIADIEVADDGFGTNILALAGADAGQFEIDGTELFLKTGTPLDFETKAAYEVAITVDDPVRGGTPDATSTSHTLAITDVNEAPTVTLANTLTTLAEHTSTASRIKVADIVVEDDALGSALLGLSGADAFRFEIDGTALFLRAGTYLEHEQTPALEVAVTADDPSIGANPDDSAALILDIAAIDSINDIFGTASSETILGTAGTDRIRGLVGHDRISGGSSGDVVYGGLGNDYILGGGGRDRLYGDAGRDRLSGGNDHDLLKGLDGNDTLLGDRGNDRLYGGRGADQLKGGLGNDRLYGNSGNDRLFADAGRDILNGGAGIDAVVAVGKASGYILKDIGHGRWTLTDRDGGTGTDVLIGIEKVVFSDGTVLL
ncbi:MAG: hypothetical protein R3D57_07710 [Hyphomicrobiaceae bacterium]